MTWGQIRMELRKELPQLDLDLLTAYLRDGYNQILASRPWAGLEAEGAILTVAPVLAGSVSVTEGSATVTGAGTAWTADLIGRVFRVQPDGDWYVVASVTGQTLELAETYRGATATGAPYLVAQHRYALPAEVKQLLTAQMPHRPMTQPSQIREDLRRWQTGTPVLWRHGPLTPEGPTGSLRTLEFWPVPDGEYAIPYIYRRAVVGFDGTNTEDGPLPWVDVETLKACVRHKAGVAGADQDRMQGMVLMAGEDDGRIPAVQMPANRWPGARGRRY
jgi:hypothetical protein